MTKSSTTVIDLRPGEEFENRRKVINLLTKSKEFIWITNYYFRPEHLEIFSEVLKENPNINEIRLLLRAPKSTSDLDVLKTYFKLFQKQFNKTSIKIRFITNKKLKDGIHDRFYYTEGEAWNFIELDSLLRNQRATISLLDPKELEKNRTSDFIKWWDDQGTFSIYDQWDKLVEVVKKREIDLVKKHEMNKENNLLTNKLKKPTSFYIYKTIKGITIKSEDEVPIELNDAINELKNLEPDSELGTSYVGFCNLSTNESLQFLRRGNEEWYAEVPIDDGEDWQGYTYKSYGNWEQIQKTLESFFAEEPFREFLPWKITRFKRWMSEKALEEDEKQQQKNWSNLK